MSDQLHVDGRIEGTVRCDAQISIGESGHIKGELEARDVVVSGSFEGRINAQRLEIVAGGRVDGEVTAAALVIESGALFNGSSRVRDFETAPRPSAAGSAGATQGNRHAEPGAHESEPA